MLGTVELVLLIVLTSIVTCIPPITGPWIQAIRGLSLAILLIVLIELLLTFVHHPVHL
jgi:hypothetical protein